VAKNVLLLGRKPFVLDDVRRNLTVRDVNLFSGTTLDDVKDAFERDVIDMVIMGAGLDLEVRLAIVRHVFTISTATTVHMKDRDSGQPGMMPFVDRILRGLTG